MSIISIVLGKIYYFVLHGTKVYPYLCNMNSDNAKQQMRKGVLDLCILSIIAEKEAYPSDVINRLKSAQLIVVEGTLYPLLTRLKDMGLLEYSWQESTQGPPRKYFRITGTGQIFLEDLKRSWYEFVGSVEQIIGDPSPPGKAPATGAD